MTLWFALPLVLGAVGIRLTHRLRQEQIDRRVALVVDWAEYRDLARRSGDSDEDAIKDLRAHGMTGLIVSALTLEELYEHHRIKFFPSPSPRAPFDVDRLQWTHPDLAAQAYQELKH